MKVLLEHIRLQTVPHDMLDELAQAGIKFYESMLSNGLGLLYLKLMPRYRLSHCPDPRSQDRKQLISFVVKLL